MVKYYSVIDCIDIIIILYNIIIVLMTSSVLIL